MINKIVPSRPSINVKEVLKKLKISLDNNFPNEGVLTKKFEKKIKDILKIKYVVATTNGTSAIYLALKANGIGKGDEVIIPNITFPATANAVSMSGAKVRLCDVSPNNLLMDIK